MLVCGNGIGWHVGRRPILERIGLEMYEIGLQSQLRRDECGIVRD
ncbi:hypothetical protein L830_0465 [Mycobacteroides abscessus MAB_082312_2258]|nr:hypothetical protein L830_0465 [Mycobacteroides abscessus MAB_082312_2258]